MDKRTLGESAYILKHIKRGKLGALVISLVGGVVLLGLFILFFLGFAYLPDAISGGQYTFLSAFILVPSFMVVTRSAMKQLRVVSRFESGRKGEQVVRELLRTLPDTYTFSSGAKLPGFRSDIDFVVVGPTGIFAIEAKNHAGRITFMNGHLLRNEDVMPGKDLLKQAAFEALHLSRYLQAKITGRIFVRSVLVFANPAAYVQTVGQSQSPITVLHARQLVHHILRAHPNASPEDIEKVKQFLHFHARSRS